MDDGGAGPNGAVVNGIHNGGIVNMEHHMTTVPMLPPAKQGLEHCVELLDLNVCMTKPSRNMGGIPIITKCATNSFGATSICVYMQSQTGLLEETDSIPTEFPRFSIGGPPCQVSMGSGGMCHLVNWQVKTLRSQ